MKVWIQLSNRFELPKFEQLVNEMWQKNVAISKAADSSEFATCTSVSMCWDKWIDDNRWQNHHKFKEYIYFELKHDHLAGTKLSIEVDDGALLLDKRAVHKAVLLIASATEGQISIDGSKWIGATDYIELHKSVLQLEFDEAIEISLTGSS